MELADNHICQAYVNDLSHKYLEKCFSDDLDDIGKELAAKDPNLSSAKSRTNLSLIKKKTWRQAVQRIIQNECVN